MDHVKRGKGRPAKYSSDEERKEAKKINDKKAYLKYKENELRNKKLAEEFKKLKQILEGQIEVH